MLLGREQVLHYMRQQVPSSGHGIARSSPSLLVCWGQLVERFRKGPGLKLLKHVYFIVHAGSRPVLAGRRRIS